MTYSFSDISIIVSHPSFGQYSAMGEGLGSIDIALANDTSIQETASDGKVVTTKIKSRSGNIAISMQQTSAFNLWLQRLYNYLEVAPSSEWEGVSITVRAPLLKETTICSRVSFQKQPNRTYNQQAQLKSWALLSADVQMNVA
jgi:hypothetical protein